MRIKKLLLMPLLAALILCGGLFPAFAQMLDHECVTLRWVAEKAAGCEDGNIRYAVCDVCDTWYSDAFPDGIISNHADVIIPGTGHAPSAEWTNDAQGHWHTCTNADCMVKLNFAAHTPEKDDKDCTTPIRCAVCGRITTAAKKHATNEWVKGQKKHWHSCKNDGCNKTYDYGWHTPEKDDGNCTTPILCTVCGQILTEGKEHAWASDWASDTRRHWHPCENEGCGEITDLSNHTVEEGADEENDNMPLMCSICGVTLTEGWNQTGGSGGCYVATSIYGSYDCPEVWTLRRFRDNRLAQTEAGRLFIQAYYAVSPALVEQFGNTQWFKAIGKTALDGLVNALKEQGFESTPYADPTW